MNHSYNYKLFSKVLLSSLQHYPNYYPIKPFPAKHIFFSYSNIEGKQLRYIWSNLPSFSLINVFSFTSFRSRIKYLLLQIVYFKYLATPPFLAKKKSSSAQSLFGGLSHLTFSIQIGAFINENKCLVACVPLRNKKNKLCYLFIKSNFNNYGKYWLKNFKSNYNRLLQHYSSNITLPLYTFSSTSDCYSLFCLESSVGTPFKKKHIERLFTSLIKVNHESNSCASIDEVLVQSAFDSNDLRFLYQFKSIKKSHLSLLNKLSDIFSHFDSNFVRVSPAHGDLCPWNIKIDSNQFRFIDLDQSFVAPLNYDIVYFIFRSYAFSFLSLSEAVHYFSFYIQSYLLLSKNNSTLLQNQNKLLISVLFKKVYLDIRSSFDQNDGTLSIKLNILACYLELLYSLDSLLNDT